MSAKYPLHQLVRIKQRRFEEAERLLKEKKEAFNKEQEKQKELEKERDKTAKHREEKIDQMCTTLDQGTTSDKIQLMKDYLGVVLEELQAKEKTVQDQIKVVEKAKEQVDIARNDLLKKQQDVEKLKLHKKEWEKEIKALLVYEEGLENDELGTAMHSNKKRTGK